MNQSPENILRALLMMPHLLRMICVFCTEKQVSTCQFHQFYILTKISVEIFSRFVYNAFIGVRMPICICALQSEEGKDLSRKEI